MRMTVAGFHFYDPSPTQVVFDAEAIAVFQHVCCSFLLCFHISLLISLVMVLVPVQCWVEMLRLAFSS